MSERRNVEALARLLDIVLHGEYSDMGMAEFYAEQLAARGVLAVDAISDRDAILTVAATRKAHEAGTPTEETTQVFRAALRRCATGEAD